MSAAERLIEAWYRARFDLYWRKQKRSQQRHNCANHLGAWLKARLGWRR